MDLQEQVGDEQGQGGVGGDETGGGEASEQEDRAEGIHEMIDVEAVAGALLLPNPGEGSVQAVAEPVEEEEEVDAEKGEGRNREEPIAQAGPGHGERHPER